MSVYPYMRTKLPYLQWIPIAAIEDYYNRDDILKAAHPASPETHEGETAGMDIDALVFNYILSQRENRIDRLALKVHLLLADNRRLTQQLEQRCWYMYMAAGITVACLLHCISSTFVSK